MPDLQCPKCNFRFPAEGGGHRFAQVALSTLMAAPAVPDMATQVRCPNCQAVFSEGDVRYLRAGVGSRIGTWLAVAVVVFIAWLAYRLLL